jgi:predicted S18 family serine protease
MEYYRKQKSTPLTSEEIKEKYKDVQEEMQEVLKWVKEEKEKLVKDNFKTHQAKSACKRNLKKAEKRVDNVKGMADYWKNRVSGMNHFRASIKLHEYWASLKEKAKKKEAKEKLEKEVKKKLPRLMRGK